MHTQNDTRTVNVGIIGLGTVGGGVVRVLAAQHETFLRDYGIDVRVARGCARTANRGRELGLDEGAFTTDWREVVRDPAIDIVVELIGGEHPATEIIEEALAHGKHVVSANKALLGVEMERLAGMAREHGLQLRCEASCAGGIPIIDALERGLAANEMTAIAGIVNGTTNYILSRMDAEGLGYADVLADAQRLGYAEADPTADVDGLDAGAKLAILSSIAFHTRVTSADVFTQGIRNVGAADIAWAREHDMRIKLLAVGRRTPAGVEARVHPALIPAGHMLAGVNGAMNAVYAVGDAVGETMLYGAGAGSLPTASAVVADILALAGPLSRGEQVAAEAEPYGRAVPVVPMDELESSFYLRVELVEDAAGAESAADALRSTLVELGVPVDPEFTVAGDEAMFTTSKVSEKAMSAALTQIEANLDLGHVASVIRIEDTAAWAQA